MARNANCSPVTAGGRLPPRSRRSRSTDRWSSSDRSLKLKYPVAVRIRWSSSPMPSNSAASVRWSVSAASSALGEVSPEGWL